MEKEKGEVGERQKIECKDVVRYIIYSLGIVRENQKNKYMGRQLYV